MTMQPQSAERWKQIDELFGRALEVAPAERPGFLAQSCGDDRDLLASVQQLLANERAAQRELGEVVHDYSSELVASLAIEEDLPGDSLIGSLAGPYRIQSELGRGGMGAVYEAVRADGEFEKRVAVKVVKRGMDTDEILRRFIVERRILASLEHPHIAGLYDGGATEDGRPYLVMELVEGERITDYCDARHLTVDQRLSLFGAVCEAVQHAHQMLVVHRDIKPSNILVTSSGILKLLDFGIARLLADDDDAPHTRTGTRLLTPAYAAPEQLRGERVTTASDVYALGAVLYELLTGHRPFEGPLEPTKLVARAVARPSVAAAGASDEAAAARSTTPYRLARLLRGDLDTIVMKAMADDRDLRYQSPQQFLDDLGRYRNGLPVLARQAGVLYRVRKSARRHRFALAAAAVIALSLAGGTGAAVWQADRAAYERDRADQQRVIAEEERDAAEEVAAFLEQMFAAADPFSVRPGRLDTMRIGAFLDRGADRVAAEFGDRPVMRARMLGVIGRAYRGMGDLDRAEPLLTQSLDIYRTAHGAAHGDVAHALNALGNLYLDREQLADAERLHREALEMRRGLFGSQHPDVAQSIGNLAAALQNSGRLDDAEPLYDEVLAIHRSLGVPDSASFADVLNNRMTLAYRRDDVASALVLAREVLDINRAMYGAAHPRVTQSMNNLGQLLARSGRYEDAEPLLRQSLEMNREILGEAHPNVAAGTGNLASALLAMDRLDEAAPLYQSAIDMTRRALGDRHPAVALLLGNYADLLVKRGSLTEAERLQREAQSINLDAFGPSHANVAIVTSRLASNLCGQGRREAGQELHRQALTTLRATLPEDHSRVTSARSAAELCSQ